MDPFKEVKMKIVYNAIMTGWTVRRLEDGRFEFTKERQKFTTDVNAQTFLSSVLQRWLNIDSRPPHRIAHIDSE